MTQRIPDVSRARRHIIKRPRLTRLLDEATARIILLVAPAGYGKTTLAREWLEGSSKPYAWYSATAASADVAVFALGLSRSLASVAPHAAERLSTRLRVPREVPPVETLAELIAEELVHASDAVLAIDDYHLAMSHASERLMEAIANGTPTRLVVTSRVRPTWVSARSILYGDVTELGSRALSFTSEEAAAVLAHHGHEPRIGLLALADGWPAVIGLAALGDRVELPEGQLAAPLHEYIAQELYEVAGNATKSWLARVTVARNPTVDLLEHLAPAEAAAVLEEAGRVGLCAALHDGRLEIHPLLRRFLERQLRSDAGRAEVAVAATRYFLDRSDWDEAHRIAHAYGLNELKMMVISSALPSLLVEGRVSTLQRWLELARCAEDDPVLDLVEAEIAFVGGDPSRSRTLALRSARRLPGRHPLASRANLRLGYAAFLLEDMEEAAKHFATAESMAREPAELRAAKWGLFLTLVHSDARSAKPLLNELIAIGSLDDPEHLVLVSQARLELALQLGGLDEAVLASEPARHLLDRVDDPQRKTAFLYTSSWAAHLTGRYNASLEAADRLLAEAQRYRLSFALPHAFVSRAAALAGLRRFVPAIRDLGQAARVAPEDVHTQANIACIHARIDLATGRARRALDRLENEPHAILTAPMRAEYVATRALVLACLGKGEAAPEADRAEAISPAIEARVSAAAARAIASNQRDGLPEASELVRIVRQTGNRDGLIAAWRAYPRLLADVRNAGARDLIQQLLPTERDRRLAGQHGWASPASPNSEALTPREQEVYALVAQGFRNREIARTLFISEVTVKVHVRHILRKLGVRTRVEAALQAANRDSQQ